jgi:DNA-binding SARP family transcriptional activator
MTRNIELATFGRLVLLRDGSVPGSTAGQRRPLAVLAILADAGDTGISRDKITALLWPDAEPEKARRALAQTLYALRKVVDNEDLFLGVADIRLNREVVTVDAADLADAIRRGELERAAELYRGPFCEGFVVSGASEFERWLDSKRAHYASQAQSVLRRLAEGARREGVLDVEIDWWRRLAALDPHDSIAITNLMDALERSGDIAGALRVGHAHEDAMRDELGLPISNAVAERIEKLEAAGVSRRERTPPRGTVQVPPRDARPEQNAESIRNATVRSKVKKIVGAALAGAAAIAVIIVSLLLRRDEPKSAVAASAPGRPDVVAILPFGVDGTDKTISFLGEGVADLMARWLSVSDKPRAVDPGMVLAILDTLDIPRGATLAATVDHARKVARTAGAGEVMIGRIAGTQAMVSISATIYDVASGDERASTQVAGKVDSLSSLVETLATRLIAQAAIGADRANAFADARFPVLRSYLRAEAAFHDDNFKGAVQLYEQALAADSTFAPAALGLAITADRRNSAEQHERGLSLAWAAREKLGGRDEAYLIALAGPRFPEPSNVGEQIAAWEKVVTFNPDRATAWTELGERFLYDGGFLGIRNASERSEAAFRKSLELDRDNPRAVRGLLQLAARDGNIRAINNILSRYDIGKIGGELGGFIRWRVAVARDDTAELRRIRSRFRSLPEPSLRAIAMASQHEAVARADGERALAMLASGAVLAPDRLDVLLAQHSAAMNAGNSLEALNITERLKDIQPGSRAHLRLRVLDALYGEGDAAAADRSAAELKNAIAQPTADETGRALNAADMCVLAQWRAAPWRRQSIDRHEANEIRAMIQSLRSAQASSSTIPVAAAPRSCADIVDAMLDVSRNSRGARSKVERLDNLMLAGPALGDGTVWATLATARLYFALGHVDRALAVIQQRPHMKGWPRYLAASLADEVKYANAAGDHDAARRAASKLSLLRDST